MTNKIIIFLMLFLFMAGTVLSGSFSQIELGSGSGKKGETITLPVTLINAPNSGISAIGIDIGYDPDVLENTAVTIGPAGSAADKNVVMSTPSQGVFRIGLIGINNTTISDGIVANVSFTVKANAAPGNTELTVKLSVSDPEGNALKIIKAKKGGGQGVAGGETVKIRITK